MKNPRSLFLLLACLLAVILAILFSGGKAPVAESAGSPPQPPVLVTESPMPDVIITPEAVVDVVEPVDPETVVEAEEVVSQAPKDWVKRTISEEWTDNAQKLAGRQRVRIVEADFKYPNLRLEEAVTTDPDTGAETVTLIRASVADHLMLGLKPGTDPELAADAIRKMGYEVRAIEPDSYILAELRMFDAAKDHARAVADLAALEEFINHAEPDYLVFPCVTPNDPAYSQGKMWGLHNPGTSADSTRDADIDAPEGWVIRKDAPSVVVAVTDTGIQYNHEDLAANMWTHPTNGSHGFDAYEDDNDPMDVGGHGTHCAGTIGARGGNSKGLTGVAWEVQLMAVRFLGPNGGSTSDAIRSVNYSRQNGAHIISASWGGGGFSQSLFNAIKACGDAGIPFVAAAGNSSTNNDATPHYPSSYKLDNIVSVASTTKKDALSSFSCYGRTSVDIAAPGSSIWSCYVGSNTAYTYLNGTSMATPHVSGALALAIAQFPTEDMDSIIARLYASVDKIPSLAGKVVTGGRLNLARLLGGAPPNISNDNFADAHRFTDNYGTWVGTNAGATRETDEDSFAGPGIGNKSLWLAFRTPHAGLVSLDITSEILGFEIIVFEGGAKGQLKRVAHSDRLGSFYRFMRFNAKADTEYRVVLDTYIVPDQRWRVDYELAPPNDFFVDATPLTGDFFAVSGYNRAATNEVFEKTKPHAGTGRGKSVWWSWTAPESGNFIINTSGSSFDTVMAIYTGANANSLTEVASNEDRSPLDWTSQVTIPAIAGTTYHIAVDSFRADAAGDIKLNGFRSGLLNIIRQPASLSVELGKRAVFDVSVLSGGEVSYQWFFNNKAIPGQTSANLVIDPVRTDDFGNYKVEVWNTENLVTSATAALSEKQTIPQLAWSSGNQAVASGTAVTLAATFSGSVPMSYAWTKNGQPVVGSTPSLTFASAQVANAGAYRLTATNTAGSASADFSLSVVASPWERWEWRRPGIPNAAITDIKVYGGEVYAVAGTTLLRSTDGVNWTKSVFPNGFTANSIAKAGSLMLCNGLDTTGQFRVATSANNGVSWTISAATGYPTTFSPEKFSLIGHKGVFIAYNTVSNPNGSDFFRSTNGTSWTRITAKNLANTTVNLSGNGSIASDGNMLILASDTSGGTVRMRYFRSTNGTTWQEFETNSPVTGSESNANTAFHDGSKFHLFASYSIHSSFDGTNWQYQSAPSNTIDYDSLFASNGDSVIAFTYGWQFFRHFRDPAEIKYRLVQPENSHAFTAAASFGGKILYGSDKGLLAIAYGPHDVAIPREKSSVLNTVEFTEGLFITRAEKPSNAANSVTDHLSGDGVTWKQNTPLDTPKITLTGSASGKHFGFANVFINSMYSGHNPFDVRSNPGETIGLSPNITFIAELPNGNALAVSSTSSSASSLLARANGSTTWTAATFPRSLSSTSKFASLGNRWFSNAGSSSSAPIYTSTDGTSWALSGLTGSYPHFTVFGGKSWCIFRNSSSAMRAAHSADGTSWTTLTPTGLPSTFFVRRVVSFGSHLVLLGSDENLYFSENGTAWQRGFAPGKVVDIAAGNGQLVAVMKNGGIIHTGSLHPGGNAPLVRIISPQTASTHQIGSRVTIEGTVSDPEDGTASYDCYMDSQLVASGSGNTFRIHVTITDPAGHTFTIRVRDSQGLRQMDAIRLKAVAPEMENLLANTQYAAIPGNNALTFDGVFYSAGSNSLHRSFDGNNWEKVSIPSFTNSIYGMASGNGALVIQFDNGAILSTRDGVNWTHFQPNLTDYWVRERVHFSSGMFIAAYQGVGTSKGSVMTSTDGLTWEAGVPSSEGYLAWTASSGNGFVIGALDQGDGGGYKTVDGGYYWLPIPALQAAGGRHSIGIFAEGRFFVAQASRTAPKMLISMDAGADEWQEHPLPQELTNSPLLLQLNGKYFLGKSDRYSWVSDDAVTWRTLSPAIGRNKLAHARGFFVGEASTGGIVTSRDGEAWDTLTGLPAGVSQILTNEDHYLLIGNDGAVWRSRDGNSWEQTVAGRSPAAVDTRLGQSIAELNSRLIAAGSGLLVTSADNGRIWANTNVNGQTPSKTNIFEKVISSGSEALVIESNNSVTNKLLRSTEGTAFATVTGLPAKSWADCAWNGAEWMLIATDGSLFRSTDGGITWNQLAVTGIVRGTAVAWFNNRWVMIGAALSGNNTPYVGFTLEAGDVLQNHGDIGFNSSISAVRTLIAHGRLVIWTTSQNIFVTSDGLSWSGSNLGQNGNFDIYATPDGFNGFYKSPFSPYATKAWRADPDALTWTAVTSPFNDIQWTDNLRERVFLFAPGAIFELHDKDLALTLPALAPISLGVGDTVSVNAKITNLGRAIPSTGTWKVTAWLAKNRFFGDTKNIPLGVFEITSPMPAPGASASYPVSFALPNQLFTGDNYLILTLGGPEDVTETNTANNTVISDTAFITIPEWEFAVATNGNGQVNRDFAATRYPHKAQVSLTASAGKGATFAGWAGDALSPNDQITILMDGNKSVQANFSNRATLQVFVNGMGEVSGLPDFGSYPVGGTAAITAVPAPGWQFSHWSGASSAQTPAASIAMNAPKTATANFVLPVATWKNSSFNAQQLADPTISGDHMDPDNDGIPTWREYLHGSHPMDKNSSGATPIVIENGFLRCVYTRNVGAAGGAALTCQAGRGLSNWDSVDLEERIISTADGIETVEARIPFTGHGMGFIRFRYDPPTQ